MRSLFTILICLVIHSSALAGATSHLYTGDAFTVPPGAVQLQSYYDSTLGAAQRVAGGSFTFGATKRLDAKLGYGYLWNNVGPDVRLGPNVGVKWRFVGDGLRKPSVAVSSLFAINEGVGGKSHKNDYGGLLIVQYPTKPAIFLFNYGRVWVGDNNAADLRYSAFAAARFISKHMLAALEYSVLEEIGNPARTGTLELVTAAAVYAPSESLFYSAQFSYLPSGRDSHLHLTLGISTYL